MLLEYKLWNPLYKTYKTLVHMNITCNFAFLKFQGGTEHIAIIHSVQLYVF